MGWFSKKPSQATIIGKEAGKTARAQVLIPINASIAFSGKSPPVDLFYDTYVCGFLMGMIYALADLSTARRGKLFSGSEKLEFMMAAIESIVGRERNARYISDLRTTSSSEDYEQGRSAGRALLLATYAYPALLEEFKAGKASIVHDALKVIEERQGFLHDIYPDWGDKEKLIWGIPEVSINRHVAEKYAL
ncbi:hypothetical protein ACMAZE_01265 [Pseudopelagicola sp. nBUS_20]|uniref:hypothetical protein n=1 Tax=Pseudopelagicola sp. nBUS_20 TaxID=3395317 RepID=UPI003EC0BF5D